MTSEEDIARALRRVHAQLEPGERLTVERYRYHRAPGMPSVPTIYNYVDGWDEALELAGLD